jgi:hypothetical protein
MIAVHIYATAVYSLVHLLYLLRMQVRTVKARRWLRLSTDYHVAAQCRVS